MPSADREVWNTLIVKAKFLRLNTVLGQELSALVLLKYLPRRFWKKGKIMSVDFHWELASDCPFGLPKISIRTHMHTHSP